MALTTLAAVKAAQTPLVSFVKNHVGNIPTPTWITAWAGTGNPVAGVYDTTLNGVALSNPVTGQIPFDDPPSGSAYLTRFQASSRSRLDTLPGGDLMLCDRLWHNGGLDVTSTVAQNIVTPAWPARDDDGATAGKGVLIALEISVATGAANPVLTLSYTNSAGVAGRTANGVYLSPATSSAGTVVLFSLQAGDVGVRSVESLTLAISWISGTINLVAYRALAFLPDARPLFTNAMDALTGGMPQLYAGSVPYLMTKPNTQNNGFTVTQGQVGYAIG